MQRRPAPRDSVLWLAAAFGAAVVAVLAVAAFFLAATQDRQREELRDRYADRVVVANALLDSLFRATFVGQTTELTQELGGAEVDSEALDLQVQRGEARWAAVVDASGEVLGSSADAPRADVPLLAARQYVQRALGGSGYALGNVEPDGLLPVAVRFPARSALAGSRVFVSSAAPATLSRFLEGTLRPLPGVPGARAYIIDGNGFPIAGLARATAAPRRIGLLTDALRTGDEGFFEAEDGRRFFASQNISRSRWRLVVTVPERSLYETVSGPSRWLPWVILALGAAALLGVGFLLRRLLLATNELERTNAELGRSNAELERSNGDLEQFAYVASHDLSEPLRTVAGFSQLLGRRYAGQLGDEADDYIAHMSTGVERMQRLIDDLLLYSRVGRAPLETRRVELGDLLDEVVREVDTAVRERDAKVTCDDLPAVLGEPGQLFQVLQNLLVNAMKFTAPGVTPEIHVGAAGEGPLWRITVADNGIGVAPEQREAIFKMFGRLHTGDAYPGTGIGLALVQRIVERHGGRIWVEDHDGPGSRFSFTVPAWTEASRTTAREEVHA